MKPHRQRKSLKSYKLICRPWILRGRAIEETCYGTLNDALITALEIAMVESEYPKKLNNPTTVTVEGYMFCGNQLRVSVTINYQTKGEYE
jgi:hypothetical protein